MNFLAHLYLSGNNEELMTGNVLADFMKGRKLEHFNEDIAKGIMLHRLIDEYTDHHPVVLETKKRLRPIFNHFAPVVADVYYDHFLAANWDKYSDIPLHVFTRHCYDVLRKHKELFPPRFQYALHYMRFRNLLRSYANNKGIKFAFERIANRSSHPSNLHLAIEELNANYTLYEEEFNLFFPDITHFINNQLPNIQTVFHC